MCGVTGPLVDSHVIPQALHVDMQNASEGAETLEIYSDLRSYSLRSRTGVYGQYVCSDCEGRFHPWDEAGIEFVRGHRTGDAGADLPGGRRNGFYAQVDYPNFKLWVMSLLWRANACQHPLFRRVQLGEKWTDVLTNFLTNEDPGTSEDFSVSASWFTDDVARFFMADPHREKYDQINYYRFYVYGGFTFLIKVDQRRSTQKFAEFQLDESGELAVLARRLSPSESRVANRVLSGHD